MLLDECFESILLAAIFSDIALHSWVRIQVEKVLLELDAVIVDVLQEALSYAHHHVADVIFPQSQISNCTLVGLDCVLSVLSHLVKALEGGNIALVDVLYILFVDQTRKTLEALFLGRVKVEARAVDRTPFAQT